MTSTQTLSGRRIIGLQFILAVLTAVLLLPVFGLVAAYSALAGGMISVIANVFFAARLFSNAGGWQAEHLTAMVYRGVIGRFFFNHSAFFYGYGVFGTIKCGGTICRLFMDSGITCNNSRNA